MSWFSRFRGQALFGIANQGLTSAENFFIGVLLLRNGTKAEYGLFVLGYGVLLFCWSLISGFITAQIYASPSADPSADAPRRPQYNRLLRSLLTVSVAVTGAACAATLLLRQLDAIAVDTKFWLLMAAGLPGMCLRDFMRRYHFQERSATRVLQMDGYALVLTLVILGLFAFFRADNLHSVAAGTMALTGLATGLLAAAAAGLSPAASRRNPYV